MFTSFSANIKEWFTLDGLVLANIKILNLRWRKENYKFEES